MTTFAIIGPGESEALRLAVQKVFPGKHLEFSPGQFVAVGPGLTTPQAAQALGANGEVGRFVVFSVNSHWGYHRKDLWDWLSTNEAG